ncbi:MAG: CinA family protein [Bdellovibrionaceae bacterium]|nr:CinA family protein [Pseudobdellovibrionaceae bacterium]
MSNSMDFIISYFLTHSLTISCAESCTGGLVSDKLIQRSGASKYFKGSVVAYSKAVKQSFLSVSDLLIEEKGIISAEVAMAMAVSCKENFSTDWALSSTGFAESTIIGGKTQKPIVYIGVVGPNVEETLVCKFDKESRNQVRQQSVIRAFDFLSECIKNKTK